MAAAPEGELGGRAAAGVPPPKSEEGAAPVEVAAAVRADGEPVVPADPAPPVVLAELVPFEPPVPTAGAAATRGVPKLLGAEAPADGALAEEPLAPKLGGLEGVAAEPDPAGGIVGRVEPAAGSKSEPLPKEEDGGGLFEGWNEPPEPT